MRCGDLFDAPADDGLDAMPEESTPLMDAAALSKARPLLWLFTTISGLVFLAVAVETLGDLADRIAEGSSAPASAVLASAAVAVILLGLLAWLIGLLTREIVEWNRVIAAPEAFVELAGTVTGIHKVLGLPYFLSTGVELDEPWRGRDAVRLLTTNGTAAKGAARTGEIAVPGERLRIQVYDSPRRRKLAVAAAAERPAHRVNLLL